MGNWIAQRNELLGKAVIKNLAKRNMEGYYCATKEEALAKALELIPETDVIAWGGSVTIDEIGLLAAVKARNPVIDRDTAATMEEKVEMMRREFGLTEYAGESIEFHASGAITFPILGKSAKIEDKLAFDPDRAKRRPVYPRVKELFPEYTVFIGGSSSFDLVPAPNDKYYALSKLCAEEGYSHDEVLYVGDDYREGGNDHAVAVSDIAFVTIDDYTKLRERLEFIL